MKKILKLLLVTMLVVMLGASSVACGDKTTETSGNATEPAKDQVEAVEGLTAEEPMKVDAQEGTVTFLAKVNGKYLYEPSRHGAVFEGGANGDKAIFKGLVEPLAFHDAFIEIGAKAGNNMTLENKDTTKVKGDAFEVTVTWNGAEKAYGFDEVVKDSNNTPIDIRFGGNHDNASDKKTGCLICLDCCPVGITSNAVYTYGAVENRNEVGFTGNKDLLPADGLVAITLKLKK